MSKKKKIFILVSMVLLLVVTGYLNVALSKKQNNLAATTTSANFFESCRADKVASRNYQLEIYDSIIAASTTDEDRNAAISAKAAIAAKMDKELVLETAIIGLGYQDAIVTDTGENLDVYVKSANGLDSDQVASILAVLVREAHVLATNVKLTPIA